MYERPRFLLEKAWGYMNSETYREHALSVVEAYIYGVDYSYSSSLALTLFMISRIIRARGRDPNLCRDWAILSESD